MNSKERFWATVKREPTDRPASWLGMPAMFEMIMEEMEYMAGAGVFNQALEPYGGNTDIVVLSELPYDSEILDLWRMQSPPKLVILSPPNGLPKLKDAIAKGDVIATVTNRPGTGFLPGAALMELNGEASACGVPSGARRSLPRGMGLRVLRACSSKPSVSKNHSSGF